MQLRDFSGDYGGQRWLRRGGLRGDGGYLVVVMVVMLAKWAESLNSCPSRSVPALRHPRARVRADLLLSLRPRLSDRVDLLSILHLFCSCWYSD
jgi:hypothetical protein